MKRDLEKEFLNSNETMKHLKISSCELMHFRLQGKLNFKKKGNAYFYEIGDVLKLNNNHA